MHSNTILTALLLIFSATSASSHLNIYARDLPLRPRRYEGASDALQKIKTGVQDGIASVQNSKSAGGHNPVPPAVGAIAGFAEGVGAICSKTTGACKYEPPKTALQTKVGKNPAEMKAANALNAANTAKGFGETDPKKIEGAKKIGKVEGAVFAASNKVQDKLRKPKAGSPLAEKKGKGKRALVARAMMEEVWRREAEAEAEEMELEVRDFEFEEEWF